VIGRSRPFKAVVARLDRAIQYAAAFVFIVSD
jgi:hypothetical protein